MMLLFFWSSEVAFLYGNTQEAYVIKNDGCKCGDKIWYDCLNITCHET
jgi:hypothetical protein